LIGDIEVATVGACRPLRARAPSGRFLHRQWDSDASPSRTLIDLAEVTDAMPDGHLAWWTNGTVGPLGVDPNAV